MGDLTRTHDWSQTSLGPPGRWPLSLRTTVGIVLHSAFPMFLFWGNELICFYNDAYRPSLGNNGKHPALGKPGNEVWPEVWDFIGPLITQVLTTGEPTFFDDQLVPIYRNGRLENVYWTFSHSPAYGDDGQIGGVLVTCTETTEKVRNAKLQQEKSELLRAVFDSSSAGISVLGSVRNEQGEITDFDYRLVNHVTEQTNSCTDLVGQRYSAIHAGYKQVGLFDDFVKVVNTGQAIERERHYTGEGFDNWYETIAVKLDDGIVFSFRDSTAIVQVRQQLDLNQQQILASFEQAPVGIAIITEENLTFRVVNSFYGELVGRAPDTLIGKPLLEALPELRGQGFDDLLRKVFATGNPFMAKEVAVNITRRNQLETIYVDFTHHPQYETNNHISGILVVCVDVTEQVLARRKVETSERYYRQLTDTVPAIIWETQPDGYCNYLSRQWYDLTGQTPAEAEGFGWLDATHPDDKAESGRLFMEANQNRTPLNSVYRLRYQDGSYRWVIDKANPRLAADGHYQGMIGTVVDIHDQKVAEEDLRASEQRFQAAVAAVQGIVWTNNAIGKMEGEQPGWAALTGQTRADYQSYGWASAVHPDDVQPTVVAWQEALAQRSTYEFEHRVRLKSGQYEPFSTRAIPLLNPDGVIREWVGVHTNVSEQRKAETALRQSQEQQSFLLQLTDQLRSLTDPLEVQYRAVCVLGEYVGANRVGYAEDQNDGQHVVVTRNYTNGVPGIEGRYRYRDYGASLLAELRTGRMVVRPDVASDSTLTEAEKQAHAVLQLGATANLPLMKAGRMTAVLFLHYNDPHTFLEQELILLNEVAERTWEAVERARVSQTLRTSEAKLRSLIANAPVAIALYVGRDLIIDLPNQIFVDVVGKGPDIAGKPLRQIMPELEDQPFLHLIDDVFTSGQLFQSFESEVRVVQQGRLVSLYYNLTYTPLFNEAGEVYAIVNMGIDVSKQVMARRQVEASEAKLRSLIMEAPVATCLYVGPDAIIELANPAMVKLYGKGDAIIGKPFLEAMPEMVAQPFPALLAELYRTGNNYEGFSTPADVLMDGVMNTYYFDFTYTPLRTVAGDVYAILGIAIDVTEQVLARRKIEASERRFRNLVAQATVATAVFTGRNMVLELANDAILDLWDKNSSIIGQTLLEFLPELLDQPFPALLDQVFTTGEMFTAQDAPVRLERNGQTEIVYVDFSYQAMRDSQEAITGILVMATDVSEKVKTRQQIEEAEASLRGAIELAELGTWELDVVMNQVTYSDRIQAWLGFKASTEGVSSTTYNPVHERDRSRVEAAIGAVLQPGSSGIYDEEYTLVNQQTGTERTVHAHGRTYFDAQGKPVKIIGTAQDVTRQRNLQYELEQQVQARTQQLQASVQDLQRSNENLQQFAYVASHDLQEPLRKIQSFGDMLRSQYSEQLGETGGDYLSRMQSSAQRMSILIRDLLTYSRISTQQDTSTQVSLTDLVALVLTDLDITITETGAEITVASLPILPGDRSQIGQLFQNLISNALKFRRPDVAPRISVSTNQVAAADLPITVRPTRAAAAYHRIDVADNGIGFNEKYLDRIFQVFQRLHGKSEFAGTGIGLAICEKVAANHGGAITATSQLGQGATFSVFLPV